MLCGAAALASCNLDTIPTDKYTVETFWETEEGTEAAMTGCYNILTNSALFGDSAPLLEETCTPNAYNYNNAGGYNVIAQGTHTANSSGIIANRWKKVLRGHRTLQHPSQPPACRRRGRRPQGADGGRGQVPPRALLLHAGDLLQRRAADPRRARLCARFAAPRLARGGGAGDSRRSERHHRPRTARLAVDQSRRPGARHARRGDGPQGPSAAFRGQQAGQPLERRREMAGCGRCGQSRDRKRRPRRATTCSATTGNSSCRRTSTAASASSTSNSRRPRTRPSIRSTFTASSTATTHRCSIW